MYVHMYVYIYIYNGVIVIVIVIVLVIVLRALEDAAVGQSTDEIGLHLPRGKGLPVPLHVEAHADTLRRRENMVGVNMVLAEYLQIQTWLF